MDKHGVDIGLVGLGNPADCSRRSSGTPSRFMAEPRDRPERHRPARCASIREAHAEHDIKAVTTFPAGCNPQVPVSDRRYYPIYQTCIDLDIPIIVNAGIAGPRVPSACQDVMHFDQVCYDFPELRIVMRHGAEPWEELAVKLMLKWPGLYYMTSRVRPQVLPEGDHRLRQHPGRRQDHVRRLLPDGPEPRAHLHRDARTCRSATTCGRSSCARTPMRVFKLEAKPMT